MFLQGVLAVCGYVQITWVRDKNDIINNFI